LVSVEKHNLKIQNCSERKIVDSKKKFSALAYAETDDQKPDKDDKSHVNKIDLTENK